MLNTMMNLQLVLFYTLTILIGQTLSFDVEYLFDPYESQPRFLAKDGHMVVLTGLNKDIVFRSSGSGRIKINGEDIAALRGELPASGGGSSSDRPMGSVSQNQAIDRLRRVLDLNRMLQSSTIDDLSKGINATIKAHLKAFGLRQRKRNRAIFRRLKRLEKLLTTDECASSPCQHGGTCEDAYNRYYCRCPSGYQGKNCEQDVDECARHKGTELDCQNGGTCLNTFGGFHCLCPPNYKGVRCTVEFNDCRNTSNVEICGHGVCQNLPRTQEGKPSYICACFAGYDKSVNSPSAPCDQDYDECATGEHHCSRDPKVDCINLTPDYTCGPCPAGYSGDGFTCVPTDRCLVNNGGCSTSPMVPCYSSREGRVTCGSCPAGFVGDGQTCDPADGDACGANNGGCSTMARCVANPAISARYRSCICPVGFTGSGIGPNGCRRSPTLTTCASNPCQNNALCFDTISNGPQCFCLAGFTGTYCETSLSSCTNSSCQNGGTCTKLRNGSTRCMCPPQFGGTFCENTREGCDAELDADSGTLSYPASNSSYYYSNNITCTWVVRNSAAVGKVLNITFTKFKIESSMLCLFDFLEIYDGPSKEYKKIGKFCGDQLPKGGRLVSSFNAMTFYFRSDPSVNSEGFELNWNTLDPVCGGTIQQKTHGMIESPGFPHHYPENRDCYWNFVANYGKRFQFIFTHLDIEPNQNCSFDYIEFREGMSMNLQPDLIAKFCNWTSTEEISLPEPITTSGSYASIHFHSDPGIGGKGFQLVFNEVPGVCGGILTGASGMFRPPTNVRPNFIGRNRLVYEHNVVCDWLIRVMEDERISLRFLMFQLEGDGLVRGSDRNHTEVCQFDRVEIYDGKDFNSPLLARLCGRMSPPEITSTGRFLRVKFRSDMSVAFAGFTAYYKALCGGEFDSPSGMLESPGFPVKPPVAQSKNCTYTIKAPYGYIVQFRFLQIDIEQNRKCLFDYVLVDGQKYCGLELPPPIESMNNELRLVYVNDDSKPSRGFRGEWNFVELGCGGVLTADDPVVPITPDRLKTTLPNNQCLWEVRANKSSLVMIKFFHVAQSKSNIVANDEDGQGDKKYSTSRARNCDHDRYIMVNDTDGSLIKRFCVEDLPPQIVSSGQKIFITYVFRKALTLDNSTTTTSKSNSTKKLPNTTMLPHFQPQESIDQQVNFYAKYYFITDRRYCDRNVFANSGYIRSPRYPRRYPSNRNCTIIVHVDNGLQIRLKVKKFQLEHRGELNGKCFDYLEIRNGRRPDSPLIGTFCGAGTLPDIVSHSNYLFFQFVSDASMSSRGFEIYYEAVSTGCGGTLVADSGSIESPDYPNHYYSNTNCEWKIRVSEGSLVSVYIVAIDIEKPHEGKCAFDYLEFFDGENDGARSLGRFCNDMSELSSNRINSSSNYLFIRFVTDETLNHGGFKLNYKTLCNRTLTGSFGVIESPNYPASHPHNLNCNWMVRVPRGNNVTVAFTSLVLESDQDCTFDHLNISEVVHNTSSSSSRFGGYISDSYRLENVHTFCGNNTIADLRPLQLNKSEVLITFVSDDSRSVESGFRLEWAATGCGGRYINRAAGTISTPNYPNPYPHEVECIWYIQAAAGNRVDLTISSMDIESSRDCIFDKVQFFAGKDETAPLLSTLCGQVQERTISSVGNAMLIKLTSDLSSSGHGFKAYFTTMNSGCGGEFSAESGTLTSPNYGMGNSYPKEADCGYKISMPGYFDVEVSVNELNIPDSSVNCSNSYLALYDAADDQSPGKLITKLCGTMQNVGTTVFRSTDSTMFLRFKGDGVNSGRGFNITYRKVCGKTIQLSADDKYKVITSSNYPHMSMDMDKQCQYILKADKPSDRVTLRFTYIDTLNIEFSYHGGLRPSNDCYLSYFEVYEGDRKVEHKRKERLCTNTIPPAIVSEGDTLLLETHFSIFKAYVSSLRSYCGGDFEAPEGQISNPGYPYSYPLNIECAWVIKAAPGNGYSLTFDDFDLEDSEFCNADYLEIRQHNATGPLVGAGRYCGSKKPQVDIDFVGDIWLRFRTDDGTVAKGFMLTFSIKPNVILRSESGAIASPGYPHGYHFDNQSFTYSIVVPHRKFIKLDFAEFSLAGQQGMSNCPIYLAIYDGLIDFSQMSTLSNNKIMNPLYQHTGLPEPRASYCGKNIPPSYVSKSNAITLVYINNYYMYHHNRFYARWSAVNATFVSQYVADEDAAAMPSNVNATFKVFLDNGQKYNLLSDNFTGYGNDVNWYFQTRESMHFNISVAQLSFHPQTSCWYNKLTIYNWLASARRWNTRKALCSGFMGTAEMSDLSSFRLHLVHNLLYDATTIQPVYNLTVVPVCGGNFTGPNGKIEAKADVSEGSRYCQWMIKVRPGRRINITIEYYSIGYQYSQCQEYLEIRNGPFADSPLLTRPLCGTNTTSHDLPQTSSNYALLTYKVSQPGKNDFRLYYLEYGHECSGERVLRNAKDVVYLQNPNYPEAPTHDVVCEWIVRGPIDSGLQITFENSKRFNCDFKNSYVEVYDGGSTLSGMVKRYCVPPFDVDTITVNNHVSLIRFVLKRQNFHSIFNATVRVDNCDRSYYVSSSYFDENDYYEFPVRSDSRLSFKSILATHPSCTLQLKTMANYYIAVNVSTANLEGYNCSAGDVIEFYDRKSMTFPFTKICPPKNETEMFYTIPSIYNELYIVYKRVNYVNNTDLDRKRIGIRFSASIKFKSCYRYINVRLYPSGVIDSPNYPSAVDRRVYCTWILYGEPGTRLWLHFNRFDLGDVHPINSSISRCDKQLKVYQNIFTTRALTKVFGCSADVPTDIYSLTNIMSFNLYATSLNEREGFSLVYRVVNDNKSCSALMDQRRGEIVSSGFDATNETGLVACAWEFKVGRNQTLAVALDTYDVPGDCSTSTLVTTHFFSNNRYSVRGVICIPEPEKPQVSGVKFVFPIYRYPEDQQNPLLVLNFNRTKAGTSRGLKGQYFIQDCGGLFDDVEGEFTSLNYPNSYSEGTYCSWFFRSMATGGDTRGYRLTFLEFDLDENCSRDAFHIQTESTKVELCKKDGTPAPIYIENKLVFTFGSNEGVKQQSGGVHKFRFKIEKVTGGCGGLLLAQSGFIQSPNFSEETSSGINQNQYPVNSECVWTMRPMSDFHITFDIKAFAMENSTNCTKDYLAIEEKQRSFNEAGGEAEVWRPLRRLCGHANGTIISQANLVRAIFHSNDKVVDRGFRINYRQSCGGLFQDESGIITSPNYRSQGNYANKLSCVYRIQRSPNEHIRVEFEDFDVEPHSTCGFDNVFVYLGDHTNSSTPKYGPYCGRVAPPVLISQELITIVFTTDSYRTKKGFQLKYNVTSCGGTLSGEHGIIDSPQMMTTNYQTCKWIISVPDNRSAVALRILELDMQVATCRYTCCHFIQIFDGKLLNTYNDYSRQLAYICTSEHHDLVFKSTSNSITIKYHHSPSSYLKQDTALLLDQHIPRFRIGWTATPGPAQGCGGVIDGKEEGVITSPDVDGDSNYEPNLNCVWKLQVPSPSRERWTLHFERFDLEDGSQLDRCDNDFLEVFDGTTLHAPQLARACGRISMPEMIRSTSGTILIQLVTDANNITGHGFRLRYKAENQTCGGTLKVSVDSPQVITSPSYPKQTEGPQECLWTFKHENYYNPMTVMRFNDLDLNCSRGDYLQIQESNANGNDMIKFEPITLCTAQAPFKLFSDNKLSLYLKINTDAKNALGPGGGSVNYAKQLFNNTTKQVKGTYRGFNITYHSSMCNETIEGLENGFIASQAYPQPEYVYQRKFCTINITAAVGQQLTLVFSKFSFYQCQNSNMTIFDGGEKAKATYCDMLSPPNPFFTRSNTLKIVIRASRMRSDITPEPNSPINRMLYGLTFIANWAADGPPGCGGNLTGSRGTFVSPNYPSFFNENRICTWRLHSGGYHTITLNFPFFLLPTFCSSSWVVIYDGDEPLAENMVTRLCGSDHPSQYTSKTSTLWVKFFSTSSNFEPGFKAEFRTNAQSTTIKGRTITADTFKFNRFLQNNVIHT